MNAMTLDSPKAQAHPDSLRSRDGDGSQVPPSVLAAVRMAPLQLMLEGRRALSRHPELGP